MHIVILTSEYTRRDLVKNRPFVQQQALALAKTHQVTVLAPELARWGDVREQLCPSSLEETGVVYRPRCWYGRGIWWLFYLLTCFWCARQIDWTTVDVVHAHFAIPAGFTAALLSRWYRKPFVLTKHTANFKALVASWPRRWLVGWTIKQARRVLVVSQAAQQEIERGGITAPFVVVPNIVNPKVFFLPPPELARDSSVIHLLWVGSLAPHHYRRKGGPELLQALALVRSRLTTGTHLTLVGDGEARAEAEAFAKQLGVANACHFAGALSHLDVRDQMQRCDALVLPSHHETFGVVLIEAMACGRPVITTCCGGPEEIVPPGMGILVEPGNPQALAEAIVRLIKELGDFDPARISAYAHDRFNPERVANMLTQVYTQVIALS